ncbi:MAG: DUF1152 domain-containing protein [Bradyrhizobium sp.]
MIPFLERLDASTSVLVAGCGGGFDIFAGVPLAQRLVTQNKRVALANFSFTNLWLCGGKRISDTLWQVDQQSAELPYFPEKWLAEWLFRQGLSAPIYAFAKSGVRPLAAAYKWIIDCHGIDTVVLIDGGTDSILFGDEPGLGSVLEDAVSIVAADQAASGQAMLVSIGFGVDHYHGVSHHAFLENVAQLTRDGGFLGAFSLPPSSVEAGAFLDLVDYANQRQPAHPSIVCNSIASALRGEFGNFHATSRTSGNELFVNPLMSQYWAFQTASVVRRMAYSHKLAETERIEDARKIIDGYRATVETRPFRPIPL